MSSSAGVGQLNPLFGRKWQVQISQITPAAVGSGPPQTTPLLSISDNSYDPEALRITFDIRQQAFQGLWEATICVYNADIAANAILDLLATQQSQQLLVTVSAGYQNGNYAVIWQGPIFQAFLERENVTDLKLTLYCVIRLPPISDSGNVGETYAAQTTQQQIVASIAKQASLPLANVSQDIDATPLPRSVTIFGNLSQHLSDIATDNDMQWWITADGLNFGGVDDSLDLSPNPSFVYSPPLNATTVGPLPQLPPGTGSIIGTPQETMYAVEFTVLLDPRVVVKWPLLTVQINNSQLRFLKQQVGQFIAPLDQDNTYVVWALRHIGDSRGETWYTQISGAKRLGDTLALRTAASVNFNNSGQTN